MSEQENEPQGEQQKLEQEKKKLAEKLGIWGRFEPIEGYEETKEFNRIRDIDRRLTEIVVG
ncbi:hypothetical protein [Paenibacillus radicis (ex Xue et al. 2023)]|uniref:Uncharacterized protein n=1 Tax=Paenibacillus radicis (ex Xue et al. 2023) TaxID=2972489 RepID=A0ABT1YKJ3_9BACL|nr:hypothetical protein [Paenibacillus radicis (ex Xue et al. 2023)]MCR8633492.1 hypothetical protein [Paenibacillus radicis (ex Xue et al. 2023)]